MTMQTIKIQPLNAKSFAPYGEVIACKDNDFFHINDQHTERYHALAEAETDAKVGLSIFRNIKNTEIPFQVSMLERHPVGSQAFIPMQGQSFLIVVAPALDQVTPDLSKLQAFISDGTQGVNYRAGTWHHPLLTLEAPSDFVVIDRIGTGPNCDVYSFPQQVCIEN
ncbi:ureidoglycolate hydrolase (plasmid) [Acinetobacter sp. NCu2D-2]|uniref:ureidoglycolate lyase n=1 Tax=Acinetobacter sp. NCu2D-2 TaxID=1608473 RepID=UPI0007CDA432|nr:ureidoglycolate lyase [Acinetobacter sp. NCu2D-2]ANF83278.1 ureidoglycolate hydrolase [Acinetobacter sp. NCu2D-2]